MGAPKFTDEQIKEVTEALMEDCEYLHHYRTEGKHRLMVVYRWAGQEFINRFESIRKGLKAHINTRFDIPAIYFMYDKDGELLYIGKTIKLCQRVSQHKKETPYAKDVAKFEVSWMVDGDIHVYEPYLINTLKPKYNKEHVSIWPPTVVLPDPIKHDLTEYWRKNFAYT